jgi:hypothetical protein
VLEASHSSAMQATCFACSPGKVLLHRCPQVHPDFQFAIGDVVLRLPEATATAPGAATSAAAPATAPAVVAGGTAAAGQPPGTEEGAADAVPPETAAATAAEASAAAVDSGSPAAAGEAAAAMDTTVPAAAGAATDAGASAAAQAAGAPAQQRPAPKTRAAQRAEWTEVHLVTTTCPETFLPHGNDGVYEQLHACCSRSVAPQTVHEAKW